jgi:hypothetical protein
MKRTLLKGKKRNCQKKKKSHKDSSYRLYIAVSPIGELEIHTELSVELKLWLNW